MAPGIDAQVSVNVSGLPDGRVIEVIRKSGIPPKLPKPSRSSTRSPTGLVASPALLTSNSSVLTPATNVGEGDLGDVGNLGGAGEVEVEFGDDFFTGGGDAEFLDDGG